MVDCEPLVPDSELFELTSPPIQFFANQRAQVDWLRNHSLAQICAMTASHSKSGGISQSALT